MLNKKLFINLIFIHLIFCIVTNSVLFLNFVGRNCSETRYTSPWRCWRNTARQIATKAAVLSSATKIEFPENSLLQNQTCEPFLRHWACPYPNLSDPGRPKFPVCPDAKTEGVRYEINKYIFEYILNTS